MNRLTLIIPLVLVAACSQEPVLDDVTQNNAQDMEPLSLPDPVESSPTATAATGHYSCAVSGRVERKGHRLRQGGATSPG